jgi:hypothetical protein
LGMVVGYKLKEPMAASTKGGGGNVNDDGERTASSSVLLWPLQFVLKQKMQRALASCRRPTFMVHYWLYGMVGWYGTIPYHTSMHAVIFVSRTCEQE